MRTSTVVIIILVTVGVVAFIAVGRISTESNQEIVYPTESTDPIDYQKCVESGGEVKGAAAPERCTLDGKAFYNGNF